MADKLPPPKSVTLKNLESALAGESQAHTKYRYFARIARAEGHEDIAQHFESTAEQELLHAWGHLELLVGKPTTAECLQMAIDGETYEFTQMYPQFEILAEVERANEASREFREQTQESMLHATQFKALLAKAERRFSALKRVEERHAAAYQTKLDNLGDAK
jgi:rubrerythrin